MQQRREPTEDELRATYAAEVRHRPHWPRTYELAMKDSYTAAVIGALARGRQVVQFGRRTVAALTPRPTSAPSAQVFDRKRLASGEKPDDD